MAYFLAKIFIFTAIDKSSEIFIIAFLTFKSHKVILHPIGSFFKLYPIISTQ